LQEIGCRHQHAGRAKIALQAVGSGKRFLQRVHRAVAPEPSTVTISAPSACTANSKQDWLGSPLSNTVQAPRLSHYYRACFYKSNERYQSITKRSADRYYPAFIDVWNEQWPKTRHRSY
jgi:hypothetical protein